MPPSVLRSSPVEAEAADTGRYAPIYVSRPVLNGQSIRAWFVAQGFLQTIAPEDMHVTLAFSRAAVPWALIVGPTGWIEIPSSSDRRLAELGVEGAVVLKFSSVVLAERWQDLRDKGCSWDWTGFQPHVTITYSADPKQREWLGWMVPWPGSILLGPERYAPLDENWDTKVREI